MRIDINTINFYPNRYWFFYWKRYTAIKGIIIRICGIHINAREDNSREKLIKIWNEHRMKRNGELPKMEKGTVC